MTMNAKPFVHNPETLDCYHPLEHAYLSDFLGVERPACAKALNPHAPEERDQVLDHDEYTSDGIFRLRPTYDGECNLYTVPNAIARMALNEHQRTLPQWGYYSGDGVVTTRHYEGRSLRRVRFDPLFLLMINYADSGPGFSWPETYHAVLFPHYDVYIVTASQDSPEVHGYVDEAFGFFPKDMDILEGVKPILCKMWPGEIEPEPDYAWESVWSEGLIGSETAYAWRAEVFGLNDEALEEEYEL
jgi:hypothetical protein